MSRNTSDENPSKGNTRSRYQCVQCGKGYWAYIASTDYGGGPGTVFHARHQETDRCPKCHEDIQKIWRDDDAQKRKLER